MTVEIDVVQQWSEGLRGLAYPFSVCGDRILLMFQAAARLVISDIRVKYISIIQKSTLYMWNAYRYENPASHLAPIRLDD